ncbi:hypothetical protein HDV05_001869 [Chytridiales sp. JEL 0842]|nr:hypothetical protein HDV05_001869 [Chytridiales sp. JEL 0842]
MDQDSASFGLQQAQAAIFAAQASCAAAQESTATAKIDYESARQRLNRWMDEHPNWEGDEAPYRARKDALDDAEKILKRREEHLKEERQNLKDREEYYLKLAGSGNVVPAVTSVAADITVAQAEVDFQTWLSERLKTRPIFTAQDSMLEIGEEANVLNFRLHSLNGIPDLLYSKEIYDDEVEIGVKMPVDELIGINNIAVVLIGVVSLILLSGSASSEADELKISSLQFLLISALILRP